MTGKTYLSISYYRGGIRVNRFSTKGDKGLSVFA